MSDFTLAEEKGFHDKVSLYLSRGMVYRLLGQSSEAAMDFKMALHIQKGNATNLVRLSFLRIFDYPLLIIVIVM